MDEADIMAIIRRMDLDGDARISKEEFVQGLMPEQPYSKTLVRMQEKERSKSRGDKGHPSRLTNYQSQPFALNLQHGQRSIFEPGSHVRNSVDLGSPLGSDHIGRHLLLKKGRVGA